VDVPEQITCVECGGAAHRVGYPDPEVGYEPGDRVAFVCSDCGHRHDVILDETDEEDRPPENW
jgi:plastocyanin